MNCVLDCGGERFKWSIRRYVSQGEAGSVTGMAQVRCLRPAKDMNAQPGTNTTMKHFQSDTGLLGNHQHVTHGQPDPHRCHFASCILGSQDIILSVSYTPVHARIRKFGIV
ncbi:protein of unknown function [Rhodovastum atsumiense]|nr:protein of unknown function [Rhodovastum atsumiense]